MSDVLLMVSLVCAVLWIVKREFDIRRAYERIGVLSRRCRLLKTFLIVHAVGGGILGAVLGAKTGVFTKGKVRRK